MTDRIARTPSAFRLNLEQQKKLAKDLLHAARNGEAASLARIAAARRRGEPKLQPDLLKLADAQFAIARELRFASWATLKSHIESMEHQWAAIGRQQTPPDGDMKTLHIRCGHDIQRTLAQAGFAGDFYAHITPYCQGPVTLGPDRHELMARFIVDAFADSSAGAASLQYEAVLDEERRRDDRLLQSADDYERVAIWMEHDSYDQLVLVRLLAHYAQANNPRVLELIAVNEFPGGERFVGVGQLPPEALRLLWSTRRPITAAQLALGSDTWNALASPDPRALAAIARSGTPALPILAPALRRHLRELPSVENGLSFTEQLIMQILLKRNTTTLRELYRASQEREPLPFLGDAGVARVVKEMAQASEPALVRTRGISDADIFSNEVTITDAGRAVATGMRDWHSLKPLPRWVGGVQVVPARPGWRWDESKHEVAVGGVQGPGPSEG